LGEKGEVNLFVFIKSYNKSNFFIMRTTTIFLLALIFSFSLTSCVTAVRTTPTHRVVVVKKLPRVHKVIYIKGQRYYKWNGVYHRKISRGFVVVRV
jgi:uncharacterized membrane protein (UPF0127 family)